MTGSKKTDRSYYFWLIAAILSVLLLLIQLISRGAAGQMLLETLDPQNPVPWTWAEFWDAITPEDRLPSIPLSLRGNAYLDFRGRGYCETLTGDILLTVIFANDSDCSWTEDQTDQLRSEIDQTVAHIEADAATYGAQVRLHTSYLSVTAAVSLNKEAPEPWVNSLLAAAGMHSKDDVNRGLEQAQGVQAAPVVFLTNQGGRSSAYTATSALAPEYAILYESTGSLYHELSHIFGGKDFYFPADVKSLADTLLPNSIMAYPADGEIDSLTAYLIGWTDQLSQEALSFLQQTNRLDKAYLQQQSDINQYTGQVTDYALSGGIYTGELSNGMPHGFGKFQWEDGTVYEGNWSYSKRSGMGTYIAASHRYTGEFKNNQMHGYGTIFWNSGDRYEGQWAEGMRSGKGTFTWASGSSYTGDFQNNKIHGEGTYTWASGNTYTGSWVDGKRSGQGKMTYESGSSYEGSWENNQFNGYGVYSWSSGGIHKGQWANGKRNGEGIYTDANGRTVTGIWENDKFIG